MTADHIRESIHNARRYLTEHPEEAVSADKPATALLEEGLRCRVEGNGWALASDMPEAVGGTASAPTPGWLARAALASCDATVLAMRAAELGISLDHLEVTVESESDGRGTVGVEGASAGPLEVRVRVHIAAQGETESRLRELVEWTEAHSPVGEIFRRSIVPVVSLEAEPMEVGSA